jgi:hypothetical protein
LLTGFTDCDYANCKDTHRSVGGYCFSLGSGMVSWSSRKQRIVADSTCVAEYIAAHDASHEVLWLRQMLSFLGFPSSHPTPLSCDNNATIRLSEDQTFHSRVKHIDVRYHFLCNQVSAGFLILTRIPSKLNTADIFTKPLDPTSFAQHCSGLGLH